MTIDISSIPQSGVTIEEEVSSDVFDINTADIKFIKPFHIRAHISKAINLLNIRVDVDSYFLFVCCCCLKEIEKYYENRFELNLPIDRNTRTIDITDDLRQEIILSYPLKPLCKDGCLGLCPKCGQDLNEKKCNCK
ncbi:MAG: DUF177 domain-containing protein [Candidatus Omnitrophota bacterium]